MKILMVLDREFPPDIRVENEIRSLQNDGHIIHLACYTLEDKHTFEIIDQLFIHRKSIPNLIYKSSVGALKLPFYFNFWRRFLKKIIKEQGFDAIHIHDLPLAKVGSEIANKYNIKFFLDLHENWPALVETSAYANTFLGKLLSSNKQWQRYEKKYTAAADYVITVVKEMKERICKLGADPGKVIVLSNTFNLDNAFELERQQRNPSTILYYAGGLTFHRGLQTVIRGLKIILSKNSNIEVWVVGSGKYMPVLEELATTEGVSENVRFFGHKPFKETMELLSRSDIALIPHYKSIQTDNSSPNKLFQYMYFAKPVLVSNCNSVERVVNEANCGCVYEYDNPESFANTVLELINSGLSENYGENGRKAVMNKYNWQHSVLSLLSTYKSLK